MFNFEEGRVLKAAPKGVKYETFRCAENDAFCGKRRFWIGGRKHETLRCAVNAEVCGNRSFKRPDEVNGR